MSQKSYLVSSAVVLAAFATCSRAQVPPHNAEIVRLLALGGERFSVRRTEHFLIASDGGESTVSPLADRLEATYQAVVRFAENLNLPIHPPFDPLPVLLFNRQSDYGRYAGTLGLKDPLAPGYYHPQTNTAAFCNVLDLPQLRAISQRIEQADAPEQIIEWKSQRDMLVETFNRLVIQHEAAHQVLFNTGVLSPNADNPDWLVEGLACRFEVCSPDGVNQMRLADFRETQSTTATADAARASSLNATKSDQRFPSLIELVANDDLTVADESKRAIRYAQAWALVDYLHRTRSAALAIYLRRTAARAPNEPTDRQSRITEFQTAFGPLDHSFEEDWIESVLKLPFDPRQSIR